MFSNQNGIYYDIVELEKRVKQNEDDIALIQQKDIDQDSELRVIENEVIRVEQKVDTHIEDLNNPHGVTEEIR